MLIHNLENLSYCGVLNSAFLQNGKTDGNVNLVKFTGNPISKPELVFFIILTIFLNFQSEALF